MNIRIKVKALFFTTIAAFFIPYFGQAQDFTAYKTGNDEDLLTNPLGGVCLMGGAVEDDNAMSWFLNQANGGDVLILRTSGSDGYNNYFYDELNVNLNSVETIVFHNQNASYAAYVHEKIKNAEAIWFAGGDQFTYVSFWRGTPVDSLIRAGIAERNMAIGGTSAGMAILGQFYFSAANGTITSSNALNNPFHPSLTVDSTRFISHPLLKNVITDTHFDNPDRKGRMMAFLAHIQEEYQADAKGIACDEYTAVCIDPTGLAAVYGGHPTYDDNAYFIQVNCALSEQSPEVYSPEAPLTWNRSGEAVLSYEIKGTSDGVRTFNLNDWFTGTGGIWENWYVENGTFQSQNGVGIDCASLSIKELPNIVDNYFIYPNPSMESITITSVDKQIQIIEIRLLNASGQLVEVIKFNEWTNDVKLNISHLEKGYYLAQIKTLSGPMQVIKWIKN